MIALDTEMTAYGARLTFPVPVKVTYEKCGEKKFAGDINLIWYGNSPRWQFKAPDLLARGPIRRTLEAAKHDALAYWEDDKTE